ncbi:hypothetical protein DM860_006732 [Cuscuta australis]|uniref:PUM-HD domain-containing protein n=1 Tax=Cuscuta australis TaxID=267555 RepID=A0A328D4D2_9ASTE|nr:hypothetical protein DM860_006732 [Cuscuta australis]
MYGVKGKGSVMMNNSFVDGNNGYYVNSDDIMAAFAAVGPPRSVPGGGGFGRLCGGDGSSSSISGGGPFDRIPAGSPALNVNIPPGHLSSSRRPINGGYNNSSDSDERNLGDGVLSDMLYKMRVGDYGRLGSNESGDRLDHHFRLINETVGRDLNCNNINNNINHFNSVIGDYGGTESLLSSSPPPNHRLLLGSRAYANNVDMRSSGDLQSPSSINGGQSFGEGFFFSPARYSRFDEGAGGGGGEDDLSLPSRSFQKINLGLGLNYPSALPIMNRTGVNVAADNIVLMKPSQTWSCSSPVGSDYKQHIQNFIIPQAHEEAEEEALMYYLKNLRMEGFRGAHSEEQPRSYGYGDILGNFQADYICNIAKNQLGCRILQRAFDQGTPQDVQLIFEGIIHRIVEFMVDQFGNYLVQKLLMFCSDEQRLQIVLRVTSEPGLLVKISLDTHGTRAVQKLVETVKTSQQIALVVGALEPGFLDLATDLNGNHVIQRCLHSFTKEQNRFILNAAARHCFEIATHRYGCCVLNKCIGYANGKARDKLLSVISLHAFILSQDAFGNYVIQYMIELKNQCTAGLLLSQLEGHFVQLSKQKFSSHVVEKCLNFMEESRPIIIHELVSVPRFELLLQDPFANYVIQSALAVAKGCLRALLVNAVRPHVALLRSNPFCKKILSQNILKKK